MSLSRELAAAEWNARRPRYVAIALLLASTVGAAFLVLAVVNGLEASLGEELSDSLGGDLRISRGREGLGDGDRIDGLRDALDGLAYADPDAAFAPRLETQAIILHGADFARAGDAEARAAAVLVGIDPASEARVSRIDALVVEGPGLAALDREWRTPEGDRLVPIVVGRAFLENGNVTVSDGDFSWGSVYNVSAGLVENGRLVEERAIVVGAYETGFRMIDRLIVYAPRGEVGRLLGEVPSAPPANVILARSDDPGTLLARAEERGFLAVGADEFRASYLGPVFASVRLAAWSIVTLLVLMTAGWMAYTLAHHVHEDRRKIATLRAVGIPDALIGRTYLALTGTLALGAAVVGAAGALLLSLLAAVLARWTSLVPPVPSWTEAFVLILLSTAAALVAVRAAYRRAARVPIREALQAP